MPRPTKPFLCKPAGMDYLWGGNRLNEEFGKEIALSPLAETWECSTHPDGPSMVADGEFAGRTLRQVLEQHPEYLGTHPKANGELPILIKFIDARQDLSVQVHPDDAYAALHEEGSLGKTEMWYVLDAEEDTRLVYGFYNDIEEEALRESLEDGTVEKYLQKIPVQKDDVFFLEAGTVHAIGAGALIAEIQENSNLTYRMYDYERKDKNGQKRPLHIDKALQVANLKSSAAPRQPMRLLRYEPGCAREFLCRCNYFQVERMLVQTAGLDAGVHYQTGSNSFQVLLCLEGDAKLQFASDVKQVPGEGDEAECICMKKGDCVFVPADSIPMRIYGKAQFLNVGC